MYIEVGERKYLFIAKANFDGYKVVGSKDGVLNIMVSASMTMEEIRYLIENKLITNHSKTIQNSIVDRVQLFDKQTPLIRKDHIHTAFLKESCIYVPPNFKTNNKNIEILKNELLTKLIMEQISFWEEKLHVLVGEIKTRKLKTNLYSVCPTTNSIVFSKNLTTKSTEYITLIVAKAVFELYNIHIDQQQTLLSSHIKNWKQLERIITYENEFGT